MKTPGSRLWTTLMTARMTVIMTHPSLRRSSCRTGSGSGRRAEDSSRSATVSGSGRRHYWQADGFRTLDTTQVSHYFVECLKTHNFPTIVLASRLVSQNMFGMCKGQVDWKLMTMTLPQNEKHAPTTDTDTAQPLNMTFLCFTGMKEMRLIKFTVCIVYI